MKIICIGRNYSQHIEELNHSKPANPLFFMKPDSALLPVNLPFFIPDFSQNIQYEVEIVLRISKVGRYINPEFALTYIGEISVGIDFTARDLQEQCIQNGLPWEISKSFDFSAPVGKFIPVEKIENLHNVNFSLLKNGNIVQMGNSNEMIFSIEEIISYVSRFLTLKTGDLIFTGTPRGVGSIQKNDILIAKIEDNELLKVKIK